MIEIKEEQERLILVSAVMGSAEGAAESLDELEDLVKTAGGCVVGRVIQKLDAIPGGTYVGTGKMEEIRKMAEELDATGIVCDDELSPIQMKNLEEGIQRKIMDRTLVILDIFAAHASTREGKIQVELAQLRYRASRLVGFRDSLSRLGGGIGTRGPGEKKLEVDRRLIHQRIGQLKAELEAVQKHRETTRKQRAKNEIPVAAIVGYTNAGKSTLLNQLTGAGVLEQDQLFATLDPTTRLLELEGGDKILLTDTVGFINKLPHHLVEAFRSTLEEAKYADIILNVADASNPRMDVQMHVVSDTLRKLGVKDKIFITLLNKQDKLEGTIIQRDFKADYSLPISAKTGEGIDSLKNLLVKILQSRKVYIEKTFSYGEAGKIQWIRQYGQLLEEQYTEEGIAVKGYIPAQMYIKLV